MSGIISATEVSTRLRITVLRRPILFISMPVGTEQTRNQKKTIEVKRLATESESSKSFLT